MIKAPFSFHMKFHHYHVTLLSLPQAPSERMSNCVADGRLEVASADEEFGVQTGWTRQAKYAAITGSIALTQ